MYDNENEEASLTNVRGLGMGSVERTGDSRDMSNSEREIDMLNNVVMDLQKGVSILHDRLSPVLRQSSPTAERNEKDLQETLSPLPSAIRHSRMNTQQVIWRINDILSRLDV